MIHMLRGLIAFLLVMAVGCHQFSCACSSHFWAGFEPELHFTSSNAHSEHCEDEAPEGEDATCAHCDVADVSAFWINLNAERLANSADRFAIVQLSNLFFAAAEVPPEKPKPLYLGRSPPYLSPVKLKTRLLN